jgi:nucleotide-binding universal stress UspA family protein
VRYGVPQEEIAAAAKELGSDLIIMGATGRTGLVQVLLGSTTRRLMRVMPCSLLTVKQDLS